MVPHDKYGRKITVLLLSTLIKHSLQYCRTRRTNKTNDKIAQSLISFVFAYFCVEYWSSQTSTTDALFLFLSLFLSFSTGLLRQWKRCPHQKNVLCEVMNGTCLCIGRKSLFQVAIECILVYGLCSCEIFSFICCCFSFWNDAKPLYAPTEHEVWDEER